MDNEDAITYYDGDDYDDDDPPENRPPKIPLGRRGWAFGIDFAAAWLLSSLVGGNSVVFLLAWLGLRVILPIRNFGQSLGRYALDIKLVENRFYKTPGFAELAQREGITGVGALLASIALANLNPGTAFYLLFLLPLGLDCGVAFADPANQLAFHDRIAGTLVVGVRRGYSLDLKVKKWVAIIRNRVQQ
jgi:uncharacterized RDD family membrane protein YckC